jgi:hypothetical protein
MRLRRLAAAFAVIIAMSAATPARGDVPGVQVLATIDGHDLARAGGNSPVRLRGGAPSTVTLRVENASPGEVFVQSVRLTGGVVGLTFFAYETQVDMRIQPGGSEERVYALNLIDLADQATGLLPSRLVLLDERRREVASRGFAADVDGSFTSVYGVFGLLIAGITAVLLVGTLIRLAAHRLSGNRWKRAVRFGTGGLGLGLTLVFTLSAMRVLLPSAGGSLALVLGCGAALFVVGYLTPSPVPRAVFVPE